MSTHAAVTPYGVDAGSKKAQVAKMFDSIAHSYDFLNHSLSLGIDYFWRATAVQALKPYSPKVILDLATGTGDFAISALKLKPTRVVGMDISEGMLEIGRQKMQRKGVASLVEMRSGDAEALPFADGEFDAITVGFGVRNFENLDLGLREMLRVLRQGGAAVVLEPAAPTAFPLKQLFQLYFHGILPRLGKLISKDSAAYNYLPESVRAFPNGQAFTDICLRAGFRSATFRPLTFGICSFYLLEK
jgi:demethylmenaquinone methyltransferase / 2-methoxy-6-polyprenyl-1,4-benzoquinol methylase